MVAIGSLSNVIVAFTAKTESVQHAVGLESENQPCRIARVQVRDALPRYEMHLLQPMDAALINGAGEKQHPISISSNLSSNVDITVNFNAA